MLSLDSGAARFDQLGTMAPIAPRGNTHRPRLPGQHLGEGLKISVATDPAPPPSTAAVRLVHFYGTCLPGARQPVSPGLTSKRY